MTSTPSGRGAPFSWPHVDYSGMASESSIMLAVCLTLIYLVYISVPYTLGGRPARRPSWGILIWDRPETIVVRLRWK
jgi:hypothetical protein